MDLKKEINKVIGKAGSSIDSFGITRQLTSVSNTSSIALSNHGYSFVEFGTSGKWTGSLAAPTSGVEKYISFRSSTLKKNQFRLVMGTTAGSKAIGINSTMRHSILFSSHALAKSTGGVMGVWIKLIGRSATRWSVVGVGSTDVTCVTITSATHPA